MLVGFRRVLLLASVACVAGCDQDPLHRAERRLPDSAYRLKKWEDERTFYLVGPLFPDTGIAGGVATEIGWRKGYILFRNTGSGARDGWFIIDTRSDTLGGPYSDSMVTRVPVISGLATLPAAQAWDSLGKHE